MAIPDALTFIGSGPSRGLQELCTIALEAAAAAGAVPASWSEHVDGAQHPGAVREVLAAAARFESAGKRGLVVGMDSGDSWRLTGSSPRGAEIELVWVRRASTATLVAASLQRLIAAVGALSDRQVVSSGALERVGGGAEGLPSVPLVPPATHATLVSPSRVLAEYDPDDAFWSSGWERVDTHGESRVCVRASQAVLGVDFLGAVDEQQRALARAAKPNRTEYFQVRLRADERDVYRRGAPRLRLTGYQAADQTLVYSGVLGPEEHVRGFEIDDLRKVVRENRTAGQDARPVREVRVIFADRQTAQRERRPLLDIGTHVFFLGDAEELVEVRD